MTPAQIESRLDLWSGLAGGRAKLINLSENHTFRIDTPDGKHHILRVHRPGYHTKPAIRSELAWLDALRTQTGLPTLTPIAGKDGALVQQFTPRTGENSIFVVRFAFEEGSEPEETGDLLGLFGDLGRLAAICHKHAENWQLPPGFVRPTWNASTILNVEGIWGDWRQAPDVQGSTQDILIRLDERLRTDLAAYGQKKHRFGLIHADMRLANLLIHKGKPRLIDFDDCGFGWFAYDFAAAVSFFEDSPQIPALKAAWLHTYRRERDFSAADEAAIDATILLRRMALLAWIGSHAETELAQLHAPNFAVGTAKLAEIYLQSRL